LDDIANVQAEEAEMAQNGQVNCRRGLEIGDLMPESDFSLLEQIFGPDMYLGSAIDGFQPRWN
jgi:hypothetical protein